MPAIATGETVVFQLVSRSHLLTALVFTTSILLSAQALAVTIGFEGVAPPSGFVSPVTPYTEGDFTLTDPAGANGIYAPAAPFVHNGTAAFSWDAFTIITLAENGGSPFTLTSFEAGYAIIGGVSPPFAVIALIGHLSGGGTVGQSFTLVPDTLTPFTLLASFTNLTSVEFFSEGSPTINRAFDNLVVNAVVPEPGTGLLIGIGLVVLSSRRRFPAEPRRRVF